MDKQTAPSRIADLAVPIAIAIVVAAVIDGIWPSDNPWVVFVAAIGGVLYSYKASRTQA